MENFIYILLALLGIGFLIFIHELGHYWMARRVGITVETFAIGFGKAIYEWEHQGVKWKVGWLPFGGYVKMAGTEKKGSIEPYQVPDGFFGKSPWSRIKVAAMGPICNIVFAFFAFCLLWTMGGRLKSFHEFTHYIGWVEQDSGLYQKGVRPGDWIESFNGRSFNGFQDLIISSFLDNRTPVLKGDQIDYFSELKQPFQYSFGGDPLLKGMGRASLAQNMLAPANYLIYDKMPSGRPNPLPEGSSLKESGLSYGDRLLWVDGNLIFSRLQLAEVLNDSKVLLTIQREDRTFLTRVPRLKITDLRLNSLEIAELDDWRHEANLTLKIQDLFFIPYNLSVQNIVENASAYVDDHSKVQSAFTQTPRAHFEIPLQAGDRVLAVDGVPIQNGYDLLKSLQVRHLQIVVQKIPSQVTLWKEADEQFFNTYDITSLQKIITSIGTHHPVEEVGNLRLLRSVVPISAKDFPLSPKERTQYEKAMAEKEKAIQALDDPKQREEALRVFKEHRERLILGLNPQNLQDRQIRYNPAPVALFAKVFQETWRTLSALLTGYLSPKNLMGPVGIVQVIHTGWTVGFKEALFWLGMISLNLGLLNLLPIPVLDGGHILFAIVESITKKPLKAKTMERLIIPFVVLLVGLFIYMTFHDITRLFR